MLFADILMLELGNICVLSIEELYSAVLVAFSLNFQVNFSYAEDGEQKQALVKLVACKRLVNFSFNRICVNSLFNQLCPQIVIFVFSHSYTLIWASEFSSVFHASFLFNNTLIGYLA